MTFRFAQLTDSHLYAGTSDAPWDAREQTYIRFVHEAAAHHVDFFVHTGDFVWGRADAAMHRRFKALIDRLSRELGCTFHLVRGNHDTGISDETYAGIYGQGTYTFAHGGWHFLAVDRYHRSYPHTQHAWAMSEDTLRHIHALVQNIPVDRPLILMVHDDPVGISRYHRGLEMLHALDKHNLRLLLFGHVQASYLGGYKGVPFVTVTGDDRPHDTSPLSYNIVTCDDNGQCTCDFHPFTTHIPTVSMKNSGSAPRRGGRVMVTNDWLNHRGPMGNRSAPVSDLDFSTEPVMAWTTKLPGRVGVGGPTLQAGCVYVSTLSRGRFEDCIACAINAYNGTLLWQITLDGTAEGGIALNDQTGYVGTSAGSVYALNLSHADPARRIRWRWNNDDNMPIACQPYVHGNDLHLGANWEAYCVDRHSGQTRWRTIATTNGFPYMGPGNATPVVVGDLVFHQRTFNAPQDGIGSLQCMRHDTGRDLTLVKTEPEIHAMHRHASPILHQGRLYFAAGGLFAVDPQQPDQVVWSAPGEPVSATPAISGDTAVVSQHKQIMAHDLPSGRLRWSVAQEPAMYHFSGNWISKWGLGEKPYGAYAAPLILNECVIICDTAGYVRCFSLNDGTEHWRLQLDAPILTAPAISGNTLFIADYEAKLHALTWFHGARS